MKKYLGNIIILIAIALLFCGYGLFNYFQGLVDQSNYYIQGNSNYIKYGDYVYKVLEDDTVEIILYKGTATSLDVPSSIEGRNVTRLGESAFYMCEGLSKVKIPDGIVDIPKRLFDWCTSLETVEIPEGIKSIGVEAFNGCTSLSYVEIPSSVEHIGADAFKECSESFFIKGHEDTYAEKYAEEKGISFKVI